MRTVCLVLQVHIRTFLNASPEDVGIFVGSGPTNPVTAPCFMSTWFWRCELAVIWIIPSRVIPCEFHTHSLIPRWMKNTGRWLGDICIYIYIYICIYIYIYTHIHVTHTDTAKKTYYPCSQEKMFTYRLQVLHQLFSSCKSNFSQLVNTDLTNTIHVYHMYIYIYTCICNNIPSSCTSDFQDIHNPECGYLGWDMRKNVTQTKRYFFRKQDIFTLRLPAKITGSNHCDDANEATSRVEVCPLVFVPLSGSCGVAASHVYVYVWICRNLHKYLHKYLHIGAM